MSEGRWPVGEAEVQNLIENGEIEEVEPSEEHADLLMRQAVYPPCIDTPARQLCGRFEEAPG